MKIVVQKLPVRGKQSLDQVRAMAEKAAKESFSFDQRVDIVLPIEPEQSNDVIISVEDLPDVPLSWHKGRKVTPSMQTDYLNSIFSEFIGKLVSAMHQAWFGKLQINSIQVHLPNTGGFGKIRLYFSSHKEE
jgi:hypothetical protein